VPQTAGIDAASHVYKLRQLANGKGEQTAELGIKETSFPSSEQWPSRLNESRSVLISRAPSGYPD